MNSKTLNIFTILINSCFLLIVFLFLIDNFSSIEIKAQWLKSFVYFGILLSPIVTLIWNLFVLKGSIQKLVISILPAFVIGLIIIIGPLKISFSSTVYKTQFVYFEKIDSPNRKLEFQMQDMGAFGYNKREVEATHYFGVFMKIKPLNETRNIENEWRKVDIDVNELDLKLP